MSWIKRNLFFAVGSVIALALLIGAGFYGFVGWRHNAEARDKLNGAYDELKRLYGSEPNPGSPGKVDNVKNAQDQQREIQAVITNALQYFRPIPPIPSSPKIDVPAFSTALGNTLDRLQREATNASISLPAPAPYNFSFQAQSRGVRFAPASLQPLSVKLGEVAAISEVLIQARVNAIDGIRRERVASAPEDLPGPPTDYLELSSRTNELAVLTPYEVTFRCFSSELAAVLAGLAGAPYGFIVEGLNVEPAVPPVAADAAAMGGGMPPTWAVAPPQAGGVYAPVPGAVPAGRANKTVLEEKELRITLLIEVVKMLPRR